MLSFIRNRKRIRRQEKKRLERKGRKIDDPFIENAACPSTVVQWAALRKNVWFGENSEYLEALGEDNSSSDPIRWDGDHVIILRRHLIFLSNLCRNISVYLKYIYRYLCQNQHCNLALDLSFGCLSFHHPLYTTKHKYCSLFSHN